MHAYGPSWIDKYRHRPTKQNDCKAVLLGSNGFPVAPRQHVVDDDPRPVPVLLSSTEEAERVLKADGGWMSYADIAERVHADQKTVRQALRRLVARGVLMVRQSETRRKFREWRYVDEEV